jgi:hypothetical protein
VDQLPHRSLAPAFCGIRPIGDIAVEIFRDGNFRGQFAPTRWHFDVLLFENNLAAVIGDFGSATLPFDLVEWRAFGITEYAFEAQTGTLFAARATHPRTSIRLVPLVELRSRNPCFQLNHTRVDQIKIANTCELR